MRVLHSLVRECATDLKQAQHVGPNSSSLDNVPHSWCETIDGKPDAHETQNATVLPEPLKAS